MAFFGKILEKLGFGGKAQSAAQTSGTGSQGAAPSGESPVQNQVRVPMRFLWST